MKNSKDICPSRGKSQISTTLLKPIRAFYLRRNIRIPKSIPLHVLAHGRRIILGLEKGRPYTDFKGRLLPPDRDLILIPVGRRWQLLAVWRETKVVPIRLLSRETNNHKRNWEKR